MTAVTIAGIFQHSNDFEIVVPGSEVPKWFDYSCEEAENLILEPDILNYSAVICEVSIKIPRNVEWEKSGLAVCVVFESPRSFMIHGNIRINGVHMGIRSWLRCWSGTESTHVLLKYVPLAGTYKPHVDGRSLLQYDTCEVAIFGCGDYSYVLDSVSVSVTSWYATKSGTSY